ncbi:nuclear transport factor 2 family protein [Microbacterium sp. zg.B48]|uniref:nuclear transport factor 2 family protein n=1 Tax=Microbacterium sp. zg.B48 TaxID=2969408 RepID=UPI00214A9A81|nr:nuclear transport factor 2 family protein [Microbacterium sp. zg.B48]MCR2765012.1 nuclear transport factor 2 family protein [Microbacterium sp. zg.B48]
MSPVDHLAILDLYARYCHAVDSRSFDAIAECFTSNAVFGERDGTESYTAVEIVERFRTHGRAGYLHQCTNVTITTPPTGTRVLTGRAHFTIVGPHGIDSFGEYKDRIARDDSGAWRFEDRVVEYWWKNTALQDGSSPEEGGAMPLAPRAERRKLPRSLAP